MAEESFIKNLTALEDESSNLLSISHILNNLAIYGEEQNDMIEIGAMFGVIEEKAQKAHDIFEKVKKSFF